MAASSSSSSSSSEPPAKRQRVEIGCETIDIAIVRTGEHADLMHSMYAMRKIVFCCDKTRSPTLFEVFSQFGTKNAFSLTPTGSALTNLNLHLTAIPDGVLYMRSWRDSEMEAMKKLISESKHLTKKKYEKELARVNRQVSVLEQMGVYFKSVLDEQAPQHLDN